MPSETDRVAWRGNGAAVSLFVQGVRIGLEGQGPHEVIAHGMAPNGGAFLTFLLDDWLRPMTAFATQRELAMNPSAHAFAALIKERLAFALDRGRELNAA